MFDPLASYRKQLSKLSAQYQLACSQVRQEREKLEQAKTEVMAAQQAQEFAQQVAATVQQQAHQRIATVVSKCLASVFQEDAYTFEIKFEKKRGKTEARMVFKRNGKDHRPLFSAGVGTVDIAALALRLTCIMLSKPQGRKVLILDEPMKNVHGEEFRIRTRELIETLATEMGFQFIIVTGFDWLKCGHVIEIG